MSNLMNLFESFRFVAPLFISIWIFLRRSVPQNRHFRSAMIGNALCGVVLTLLNPIFLNSFLMLDLSPAAMTLSMSAWILTTFLLPLPLTHWCYATSWTDILSRWLLGICVERFLTTFIRNMLFTVIVPDFTQENPLWYVLIITCTYTATLLCVAKWVAPLFDKVLFPQGQESRAFMALYIVSFLVIYLTSNAATGIVELHLPRITLDRDEHSTYILIFTTAMAGLLSIIVFLFQYVIHYISELRQERALLGMLTSQRSHQYESMKTTMEVMNEHIHNFKHQLIALQNSSDEQQKKYSQEMQNLVDRYGTIIRTGNESLDIILNQHRIECARNSIRFTTMVEPMNLERIDVVDLYTIVGNALDNATEYVLTLDDTDKRVISMTGHRHGNLVIFTFDNYFEPGDSTDPAFEDGLPQTTKTDKLFHGIGLKSIRALARRYGGDVNVTILEHTFSLSVSLKV